MIRWAIAVALAIRADAQECHIGVCGCPDSYAQDWCENVNSLVQSDWCQIDESNCEKCGGHFCSTNSGDITGGQAVATLDAYPDYTGDKAIAGTVVVAETDNGIKMFGTVVGLAVSGTGGIHIHSGVSCATTADPGGHYFDGMTADPWTTTYTADASGVASVEFEIGDFTLSGAYPVAGRVVVVHDTDGSRIACGVVTPTEGEVVTMGTYPDYTGAVTMAGTLLVKDSEAGLSITGTLGGLEASASGGLHIHSGYTCDVAAGVGGHYFEGMTSDPWTTTYTTDANGYSSVAMELADFTMEEGFPVAARAMVAHASTGARVGCGLVSAVAASATAEGPSYECRISHCGCPGAYTQAWCSDSNSLISSEWCGKSKTNCEDNCHGSYCPYA